jgi:hypothetical protein
MDIYGICYVRASKVPLFVEANLMTKSHEKGHTPLFLYLKVEVDT